MKAPLNLLCPACHTPLPADAHAVVFDNAARIFGFCHRAGSSVTSAVRLGTMLSPLCIDDNGCVDRRGLPTSCTAVIGPASRIRKIDWHGCPRSLSSKTAS